MEKLTIFTIATIIGYGSGTFNTWLMLDGMDKINNVLADWLMVLF